VLPTDIETEDALAHLSSPGAKISLSRRRFLQAVGAGMGTVAATSMFSNDAWGIQSYGPRDGVLLLVTLYGGNDGLNTLIPYTNGAYYSKRPNIAIAANSVLPINNTLGFHPTMPFFKSQFDAGKLAVVQGVGMMNPDFSHFTAMDAWMGGWGGSGQRFDGWLGRYIDGLATPDVVRSINIGWESVPLTLTGATQSAVALSTSSGGFGVDQASWRTEMYDAIRDLQVRTTGSFGPWGAPIAESFRDQLDAGAAVAPAYPSEFTGSHELKAFVIAARLINANIGSRVINVSIGGFDNHDSQLGYHAENLKTLNDGLQLFWSELSPYFQTRTTSLVWSEFGRRLVDNNSNGTDHGAAGLAFLMGPRVRGGLHGAYPSLTQTLQHDQLAPSISYHSVYAQVLDRWMNSDSRQVLGATYGGLDLFSAAPGDDTPPPPPDVVASPSGFVPMTPARMLDTRSGTGVPAGKVGSNQKITVKLGGVGSVPATNATAVLVNVTVTDPSEGGYITVWPDGATQPVASNLNFGRGQTIPNLVLAKLGTDGRIGLFNSNGSTHLIGDVVGYFVETGGSGLVPLAPTRLLDTRGGSPGAIGSAKSIDLQVTGRAGVPAGAQAVVMNVTAIDPTAAGYLTVWPSGESMPNTSSLNFSARQTIPNLVVAKVGKSGRVSMFNAAGTTHVAVDVVGYFTTDAGCESVPMKPVRLLDTRSKGGKIPPGGSIDLVVAGVSGVPDSGVEAVTVNITSVDPTSSGYITVWPTGSARPNASSLNFAAGQNIPNLVMAKVGAGNKISLFNSHGNTHLIVDLCGYFLQ
jgi:uncharacterized protein (DUF1501 family)